jgi:hypothetical protein
MMRLPPVALLVSAATFSMLALACGDGERELPPATVAPATIAGATRTDAGGAIAEPSRVVEVPPSATQVDTAVEGPSTVAGVPNRSFAPTGGGDGQVEAVRAFTNIAIEALGEKAFVQNDLPGLAIFDFDRDGNLDFYVTQSEGSPNFLFRGHGDGTFDEMAPEAGVAAVKSNSTGVAACDIDNDGFQDLYVSAQGRIGDGAGYRAAKEDPALKEAVMDRLFLNNGDGTFSEITMQAFGDDVNLRTGTSVGCADVDGDGWLDIYVANRADLDSFHADQPTFGNLNVLYRNNGDLTFTDITRDAGVTGEQTVTWAVLFFDYDDDGDPDLWTAEDGARMHVYRNISNGEKIRFTPVERAMGIDKVGSWMGFALGDFDGDADLDVFVTNIGFHPRTRPAPFGGGNDCAVVQQFEWGTCDHFLLRNDGVTDAGSMGTVGLFADVAAATTIKPSRVMPPASLEPMRILMGWQVPTGLAAYDFGFGATFFDMENDGDQDLYWLGSALGRGESPLGRAFPSAGRMLRGDGQGGFEDVTVEAHLLGIQGVDYSVLDPQDPAFDARRQRLVPDVHENGKGVAKGDLDNDGYPDLIATNSSGPIFAADGSLTSAKGPTFVWMNPGAENHWLSLRLKGRMAIDGTGSNADAIGARVYLKAEVAEGKSTVQVAEVLASSSFMSMSSVDLSFGLGVAEEASEITIFWPSGVRQVLVGVPADQVLEVEEPAG